MLQPLGVNTYRFFALHVMLFSIMIIDILYANSTQEAIKPHSAVSSFAFSSSFKQKKCDIFSKRRSSSLRLQYKCLKSDTLKWSNDVIHPHRDSKGQITQVFQMPFDSKSASEKQHLRFVWISSHCVMEILINVRPLRVREDYAICQHSKVDY